MEYDFKLDKDAALSEKAVVALSKVGMKVYPAMVHGIGAVVGSAMTTGQAAKNMMEKQVNKRKKVEVEEVEED